MATMIQPTHGLPPWLLDILNQISVNPVSTSITTAGAVGEPILKSIGKELSELLGTVFETNPGAAKAPKVPRKLRFSGMATGGDVERRGGKMLMQADAGPHGMISTGVEPQPFEISPSDMDTLLASGKAGIEQPPAGPTAAIQRRLKAMLDRGK